MTQRILSCGHPPTPQPAGAGGTGVATLPDGREVCYACSDELERARMATVEVMHGYLSGDGRRITTWPGGELAHITSTSTRRVGFRGGNGRRSERTYFHAVDATGQNWHGQSPGPSMLATMRRVKVQP